MISTISDLHAAFETLRASLTGGLLTVGLYIEALEGLKQEADAAHLPFIFSVEDIERSAPAAIPHETVLASNDNDEPYLATLAELDAEPDSSESEMSESSETSDYSDFTDGDIVASEDGF